METTCNMGSIAQAVHYETENRGVHDFIKREVKDFSPPQQLLIYLRLKLDFINNSRERSY